MRVDRFDYQVPAELIAQRPTDERDGARLLLLAGSDAPPAHLRVNQFPELIPEGALVVMNDTRVVPARLVGHKEETGGRTELFLLRRVGTRTVQDPKLDTIELHVWRALGKASKSLKFGGDVYIPARADALTVGTTRPRLVARLLGRSEEDGLLEVGLFSPTGEPIDEALKACGHVPLPPYIRRDDDIADVERYQTVVARVDGAVAAPTAGLHITGAMIGRLVVRGCELATVTLHVGLGTFQPVTAEDLDNHVMHVEELSISTTTVKAIEAARARGAPVIAVGTTTVRALESAADPERPGHVRAEAGKTNLLIQPGYRFRVVDGLLTNFHVPKSTLLALVCAFGGTERVLSAYQSAVSEKYRFFSYGDAMLLLPGSRRDS